MTDQQFEAILRQALCPEIAPEALAVHSRSIRKGTNMNIKRFVKRACAAAAIIALLATTAYAADALNVKTLLSGGGRACETVAQAEEKAGFRMDDLDRFSNGYAVDNIRVLEVKALDEKDKVRLIYNEIDTELKNAAGDRLSLSAYQRNDRIPSTDLPPHQTRVIGETTVSFRVDHYKFVPEGYTLTEADEAMLETPGNFLSYGSEEVEEKDVAFLTWEKDGICYILMDPEARESAESLFSMARELILTGK